MHSNISKTCGLLALILAVALVMAAGREPSAPYLPVSGPPPLRFQKVHPQNPAILPPLPKDDAKPTDRNGQLAKGPAYPSFPLLPASAGPAAWIAPSGTPGGGVSNSPGAFPLLPPLNSSITNSAASSPTANDLLSVHPQMLIEYFKPVNASTGSAGVSAFLPVEFTPATPASAPDSQSAYRRQ